MNCWWAKKPPDIIKILAFCYFLNNLEVIARLTNLPEGLHFAKTASLNTVKYYLFQELKLCELISLET